MEEKLSKTEVRQGTGPRANGLRVVRLHGIGNFGRRFFAIVFLLYSRFSADALS